MAAVLSPSHSSYRPTSNGNKTIEPLHRDLRTLNRPMTATNAGASPSVGDIVKSAYADLSHKRNPSLVNDHFGGQVVSVDLRNPISSSVSPPPTSSSRTRLPHPTQRLESRPAVLEGDSLSPHVYRNYQAQSKSSTASLAEFLKTTGPEDLDLRAPTYSPNMNRPLSPTRKKNFLLKFAVGKSANTTTRRDEISRLMVLFPHHHSLNHKLLPLAGSILPSKSITLTMKNPSLSDLCLPFQLRIPEAIQEVNLTIMRSLHGRNTID